MWQQRLHRAEARAAGLRALGKHGFDTLECENILFGYYLNVVVHNAFDIVILHSLEFLSQSTSYRTFRKYSICFFLSFSPMI